MTRSTPRLHGYLLVAGALVLALAVLSVYAWRTHHASWEVRLIRWLQEAGLPGLRPLSIGLAEAGTGVPWIGLIAVIGLLLLALGGLRFVFLLGVTASMQDLGAVIKLLVERARPADGSVQVWKEITSYSFPSGHTLGATLVFGFLFFALEHCEIAAPLRRVLQAACVAWVVLMGLARMQLGAHWPTDVLGAYLVGALCLLPSIYLLRRSTPAATVAAQRGG